MIENISTTNRKLSIDEVLTWLVIDRLISKDEEQGIKHYAVRWENREKNLITIICDYQSFNKSSLNKQFTENSLNEWLANRKREKEKKGTLPFFRSTNAFKKNRNSKPQRQGIMKWMITISLSTACK